MCCLAPHSNHNQLYAPHVFLVPVMTEGNLARRHCGWIARRSPSSLARGPPVLCPAPASYACLQPIFYFYSYFVFQVPLLWVSI